MQPLELQLYGFFVTVLAGCAMGLWFDLLRAVRRRFRPDDAWTVGADLIFWVLCTLTLGAALLAGTRGEVRVQVLLAVGVGVALYLSLGSPVTLWILDVCLGVVVAVAQALVRTLRRWVLTPLAALVAFSLRTAGAVVRGLLRPVAAAARSVARPVRAAHLSLVGRLQRWLRRGRSHPDLPPEDPPAGDPRL